jgi:hypothetical protein
LKPGFYAGDDLTGDMVRFTALTEVTGFRLIAPTCVRRSLISGVGIARQRDLGLIDMRKVAPTMAQPSGVALPTAKAVPLHVTL